MIVDPDFPDHWKTRMLVGLLGNDESAPMLVIRLWAHCQLRKQWTFDNLTPASLKALCRFPGHANLLESSLAASGFVRREGETLIVSGWDEYNASLIAAWSNGKKSNGRPPKNPRDNPRDTQGFASREEKKREDKNPGGVGVRNFGETPQGLAQEFCFHATRTKGRGVKADLPEDATPIMADLLKAGLSPTEISAEIQRKDRLTTEYLWEFKARLLERTSHAKRSTDAGRGTSPTRIQSTPERTKRLQAISKPIGNSAPQGVDSGADGQGPGPHHSPGKTPVPSPVAPPVRDGP